MADDAARARELANEFAVYVARTVSYDRAIRVDGEWELHGLVFEYRDEIAAALRFYADSLAGAAEAGERG